MSALNDIALVRTLTRVAVIPLLILIAFAPAAPHSPGQVAQPKFDETARQASWQRSNISRDDERQKLETFILAGQAFTAAGADLTPVKAAVADANTLMLLPYLFPGVGVLPNYIAAGAAITTAETGATAQAAAITAEAARVAAESAARAAQASASSSAQAVARSAQTSAHASARSATRAPVTVPGPASSSRFVIRVAGVASNQAGINAGGIRDITAWMAQGKPELAAHWTSGGGSRIPRGAGQLFTVVGAGALDGNYISSGIIAYLNVNTQDASAIPGGYALLFTSCYMNDSSHEEIIGMQRG